MTATRRPNTWMEKGSDVEHLPAQWSMVPCVTPRVFSAQFQLLLQLFFKGLHLFPSTKHLQLQTPGHTRWDGDTWKAEKQTNSWEPSWVCALFSYLQLTEVSTNTPPFAERQTKQGFIFTQLWGTTQNQSDVFLTRWGRQQATSVLFIEWLLIACLLFLLPSFLPKLPPSCLCTHTSASQRITAGK